MKGNLIWTQSNKYTHKKVEATQFKLNMRITKPPSKHPKMYCRKMPFLKKAVERTIFQGESLPSSLLGLFFHSCFGLHLTQCPRFRYSLIFSAEFL